MTKSEALKRSIEIAVERGWDMRGCEDFQVVEDFTEQELMLEVFNVKEEIPPFIDIKFKMPKSKGGKWIEIDTYNLLFSHDFCKALFGTRLLCYDCGEPVGPPITVMGGRVQIGTGECDCSRQFEENEPEWEFRLKQMVLYEDPLDYLVEYLEGREK